LICPSHEYPDICQRSIPRNFPQRTIVSSAVMSRWVQILFIVYCCLGRKYALWKWIG